MPPDLPCGAILCQRKSRPAQRFFRIWPGKSSRPVSERAMKLICSSLTKSAKNLCLAKFFKTSAIPEDPFHFITILEGVFGFLGILPVLRFLAAQDFFFWWTGDRSIMWSYSWSCKFSFRSPPTWLRTASSLASLSSSLSSCNFLEFKLLFFCF